MGKQCSKTLMIMKTGYKCQNKVYEFASAMEAKAFALGLGVENDFLFNNKYPEQNQPATIYVSDWGSGLQALVILFAVTCEMGLWVDPRIRGSGIGGLAFNAVIKSLENHGRKLLAFVDPSNEYSVAMRRILANNGFAPMWLSDSEKPALWIRSFAD